VFVIFVSSARPSSGVWNHKKNLFVILKKKQSNKNIQNKKKISTKLL
jgi:hypothetical protein